MAAMTTTHDEKIMNYLGEDFNEFVALFDEDEIAEMRDWLESEDVGYSYDFLDLPYPDGTYKDEEEKRNYIIIDYVKEWLVQQIRGGIIRGTNHLFNLVTTVLI